MEKLVREILLNNELINLVGRDSDNNPKIYLLHAPDDTSGPYIEYEIIEETGSLYAEDKEIVIRYRLQIDIFTRGSYEDIRNKVKEILKEYKNFRKEFGSSTYEGDTKLFHYILRYNIEIENESEE